MRIAQYLASVILGIGGLILGDAIGPLSGIVYDWDTMMDPEYSRAIKTYHGIVVGAFATLPLLLIGRVFKISELAVMASALILAMVFYLLPFLKVGDLFSLSTLVSLPLLLAPYILGMFTSFGAVSVVQKLWSLMRAAPRL